MRPGALEVRLKDQVTVLDRAAALVKPGGRIAYVTCSGIATGERRANPRLCSAPSGIRRGAASADRDRAVGQGGGIRCGDAAIGGAVDDAATDRHRLILRVGAAPGLILSVVPSFRDGPKDQTRNFARCRAFKSTFRVRCCASPRNDSHFALGECARWLAEPWTILPRGIQPQIFADLLRRARSRRRQRGCRGWCRWRSARSADRAKAASAFDQ